MAGYMRQKCRPLVEVWEWRSRGACRGYDSLFFHPRGERGPSRRKRVAQAKALCTNCPVLDQCRQYSLDVGEEFGTWGGLDERERRALLKKRKASASSDPTSAAA
jgi:WhiB family transcriptional regulator, redox-sensing transcriptional regulator